ncbi:MAG: hypothetical protein IIY37_05175, partial [Selenomonadaceae bacterium]|nr:hypothetical protein [Selenomonadaceae bacterium]
KAALRSLGLDRSPPRARPAKRPWNQTSVRPVPHHYNAIVQLLSIEKSFLSAFQRGKRGLLLQKFLEKIALILDNI